MKPTPRVEACRAFLTHHQFLAKTGALLLGFSKVSIFLSQEEQEKQHIKTLEQG